MYFRLPICRITLQVSRYYFKTTMLPANIYTYLYFSSNRSFRKLFCSYDCWNYRKLFYVIFCKKISLKNVHNFCLHKGRRFCVVLLKILVLFFIPTLCFVHASNINGYEIVFRSKWNRSFDFALKSI